MRRNLLTLATLYLALCFAPPSAADRTDFLIDYTVSLVPEDGAADVTMAVRPDTGRAKRFTFTMEPDQYSAITGDGVKIAGETVTWTVPKAGGTLRYRYGPINQTRSNGAFDAYITKDWTILRGDDLFPSAATVLTKGADSKTRLRFDLPDDWTFVDTGYTRTRDGEAYVVTNAERSFDRPVGWIIAGKVGSRREQIGDVELAVAAPRGSALQRNVVIAMGNWIFPEMQRAFGELPPKVLIVGADDPMWRGGLSSPNSFYMHSSRPLISENYTSTLIHELVHLVTRIRDKPGYDWITEGLAEFYSIELLRRSGGMTDARYAKVRAFMQDWGKDVTELRAKRSTGERTARAVLFFQQLDTEIRVKTDGEKTMDHVTRLLMDMRKVDLDDLREASEAVAGSTLDTFDSPLLRTRTD